MQTQDTEIPEPEAPDTNVAGTPLQTIDVQGAKAAEQEAPTTPGSGQHTYSWAADLTLGLLAVVFASLLFSSLLQRYTGHVLSNPDVDFRDYYFAAQVVRETPRGHLYEGATTGNPQLRSAPTNSPMAHKAREAGFDDVELYLYPPLFADLMTPLTFLPLPKAAVLWRLLNLAVVLASVLLLARMVRVPKRSGQCAILLTLAYAFWPVHEAISLGQITVILLGLWTVGVVAYAEGWIVFSALALALATAFKVTPVLLLPAMLIWRDRRWLLSYSVAILVLFGIMIVWNGPVALLEYAHVAAGMGGVLPAVGNKCISSITAWVYYHRTFNLDAVHAVLGSAPPLLNWAAKLLSALFYAVCLWSVWRSRYKISRYNRALVLAVFALITCVLAPVSWRHGYTVALVPLALLWERRLRDTWLGWPLWSLTLFSIAAGSLFFDLAAQGPFSPGMKAFLASLWPLSAVGLCLWALAAIRLDTIRHELTPAEFEDAVYTSRGIMSIKE